MVEKGVVFGRFQVLHNKHMEYLLAAKMRCKKLYIGITHQDITMFAATSHLDVNGGTRRDNPMTYLERVEMIRASVEDFGIKKEDYEIIPFPITHPELILQYAPQDATYFVNIKSEWDEQKKQIIEKLGLKVEVLINKTPEDAGITASEIRKLITEEKEWKQYVPKPVFEYIRQNEIDKRIRELYKKFEIEIEELL